MNLFNMFSALSQSDCVKNMPPSNMQYIAPSLANQIAHIFCVDDISRISNLRPLVVICHHISDKKDKQNLIPEIILKQISKSIGEKQVLNIRVLIDRT